MSMQIEAMIQRERGVSLLVVAYCSCLDCMVCTLTSIVDKQLWDLTRDLLPSIQIGVSTDLLTSM